MSTIEKLVEALRIIDGLAVCPPKAKDELRRQMSAVARTALAAYDAEQAAQPSFTVFCRESTGEGTIYIESAQAATWREAADEVHATCAESWDMGADEIDVIGVVRGDVDVIAWDDEPGGGGIDLTQVTDDTCSNGPQA